MFLKHSAKEYPVLQIQPNPLFQDPSGSKHLVHLINVYCPRADPERPERLTFKLKFYQLLEMRAAALKQIGHVIILGDINTSHREIDRCQQLPQVRFIPFYPCNNDIY